MVRQCVRLKPADGFFGAEVGQETNRAAHVEKCAPGFADAEFANKFPEVEDGKEMQISRVMPGLRQRAGHRGAPVKQNLQTPAQVSEVRISDDDFTPNTKSFAKEFRWLDQFLEGAEQQHEIKCAIAVLVESVGNVTVINR